jgi:hypothetical protein
MFFVPELIEAVYVDDSASMLPFYVMTLSQSRRPQLVASFQLHPRAPLLILNCSPSEFGSSFFVALVSTAHVSPSNLDSFCSPLVEILNGVASQMLYSVGSGAMGSTLFPYPIQLISRRHIISPRASSPQRAPLQRRSYASDS